MNTYSFGYSMYYDYENKCSPKYPCEYAVWENTDCTRCPYRKKCRSNIYP